MCALRALGVMPQGAAARNRQERESSLKMKLERGLAYKTLPLTTWKRISRQKRSLLMEMMLFKSKRVFAQI